MKKQILLTLGLITLLASATQASQEQLATSIKDARDEANRATEQLKATLGALTTLTQQKEGDLRPAFTAFSEEIPKTEAAAAWTRTRAQWMSGDGMKYFESWQKSIDGISNLSLKKKGQKRLDAAKQGYAKVESALRSAGDKFQPFLSDLTDIQKILSSDLTAAGIKNVKSTVSNANWRYKSVNAVFKDALKEMEKMEKALSPEAK